MFTLDDFALIRFENVSKTYVYGPAQALSGVSALIRVMEAGFERYDAIKQERIIDAGGKDITLKRFDIEIDHVTFSYEEQETLNPKVSIDVVFRISRAS